MECLPPRLDRRSGAALAGAEVVGRPTRPPVPATAAAPAPRPCSGPCWLASRRAASRRGRVFLWSLSMPPLGFPYRVRGGFRIFLPFFSAEKKLGRRLASERSRPASAMWPRAVALGVLASTCAAFSPSMPGGLLRSRTASSPIGRTPRSPPTKPPRACGRRRSRGCKRRASASARARGRVCVACCLRACGARLTGVSRLRCVVRAASGAGAHARVERRRWCRRRSTPRRRARTASAT